MKTDPLFYTSKTDILDTVNRVRYFRSTTITTKLTESSARSVFNKLYLQGCNLLRYVVFWEDIETSDGSYNEEFLAELRNVLKLASEYGLFIILEPAVATIDYKENKYSLPKWILEKLKLTSQDETPISGTEHKASNKAAYKTEYKTRALQRFFTLFFCGNKCESDFKIDGDNAQDYLQEHYIEAVYHLTRRLKDCDSIIGTSTMQDMPNEYALQNQENGITSLDFEAELIAKLYKKHANYIFFIKNINCAKIELKDDFSFALCKEYNGAKPAEPRLFRKQNDELQKFIEENVRIANESKVPFVFYDDFSFSDKDNVLICNYLKLLDQYKTSAFLGNEKSFSLIKPLPYPIAIAGSLVRFKFDEKHTSLEMEWNSNTCPTAAGDADTEIFLPKSFFAKGWNVEKFDGVGVLREDIETQRLFVKTLQSRRCFLKLIGKK